MFAEYHDDLIENGIKDIIKYLDESRDFFWLLSGNSSSSDYKTVSSLLLSHHPLVKYLEFDWNPLHIHPLTKNIAVYTGVVEGVQLDTSNIKSSFKVVESGTLVKRKDGWKFLSGQSKNVSKN
ncbi:hypothetical protein [Seonamhaeicola maritimus]|uniref:Nuclear transport factor 2 family protein n=1 Tax=Seonamhaeicola maritimus TaxID=2591822 RepID=A0A5C7GE88_9FLAO|nr:hypothetical protein [Seonamhaeicola maritimus]TXG34763.1 hypothetical protein FUA22_17800 [Seonamhaeicola maritimus]